MATLVCSKRVYHGLSVDMNYELRHNLAVRDGLTASESRNVS